MRNVTARRRWTCPSMRWTTGAPNCRAEGDYWIAPNATLIGRVRLLTGASVWFGSVLRGDNDWITIGERSNIQDLCDPAHRSRHSADARRQCHGRPRRRSSRRDRRRQHASSAWARRCSTAPRSARISIVGAHALIPEGKEFPDNSLIVGVPGKVDPQLHR